MIQFSSREPVLIWPPAQRNKIARKGCPICQFFHFLPFRTTLSQHSYLPEEKLEPEIIFDDEFLEIIEKNGGKVTVQMARDELEKRIRIYSELAGLETDSAHIC